MAFAPPPREDLRDLGFGSRVTQNSRTRLLNRDGSFNVARKKLPFLGSLSPYHYLLTISWGRFHLLVIGAYLLFNIAFASAYYAAGKGSLAGLEGVSEQSQFMEDFFFSVQTSTTIGYGRIAPVGTAANILASVEALFGLLGFALATSLMFARFSRPEAKIRYSDRALVAPYRGITAVMFRLANERNNQLIQVGVKVLLSRMEDGPAGRVRRFVPLGLERDEVVFFPLTWTVVHPIDEASPFRGIAEAEFRATEPELLVLLTATDETSGQIIHSRTSYTADELIWGAKFSDVFDPSTGGTIAVDLHRIHGFERVPLTS
jgi:inward rectifier potassium channel